MDACDINLTLGHMMLNYSLPQVTARGVISTPPSPVPPSLGSIICGAAAATDKRVKTRNPYKKRCSIILYDKYYKTYKTH